MKIAVILHGYNVGEDPSQTDAVNRAEQVITPAFNDWDRVMMGHESRAGRAPVAIELARRLSAHYLIFSTGASKTADGKWEAEVIYDLARRSYARMLSQFPHRFNKELWRSEGAYLRWLEQVARFDTASKNTSECMQVVQRMIRSDVLHRRERIMVYNVSSANHIQRVMRDAGVAFKIGTEDAPLMQYVTMMGVMAETCYGRRFVSDTIVDDLGKTYIPRPKPGVDESE